MTIKLLTTISLVAMLAACGGGGSGGGNTGGGDIGGGDTGGGDTGGGDTGGGDTGGGDTGGGDTGGGDTGGGTSSSSIGDIIAADGVTETVTLDAIESNGEINDLTLDPNAKTWTITFEDGTTQSGPFDPETGIMTITDTEEETSTYLIALSDFNINTLDYTSLINNGDALAGIGVERTDASALPTVNGVTYNGVFESNVGSGTSTTTANFGSGLVDASFSGLSGEAAGATLEVTGMTIEGSSFSGGITQLTTAEGFSTNDFDISEAGGAFYGPNGEEVAGGIDIYDYNSGNEIEIYGIWNGAQ